MLVGLAWMLLGGCSHQDFSGTVRNPMTPRRAMPPGAGGEEDLAASQTERLMAALVSWESRAEATKETYALGPNDVLQVDVMSLETPGQLSRLMLTVGEDGAIDLPWFGELPVAGLSIVELEQRVTEAYRDDYIKNPQVTAGIAEYQSVRVIVTGAVGKPGVLYLKKNAGTLLEVLALAGGFNGGASDEVVIIRGGPRTGPSAETGEKPEGGEVHERIDLDALMAAGKLITVDLEALLEEGDFRMNVQIRGGDIVNVRPRTRKYVYVLGYVTRPGSFEIPGGDDGLDAVRAVALAGGLSPSARAQNSFIVRESHEGKEIVPVNLVKAARGKVPTIRVAAGDTLVVGSDFLARLGEFVKPSAAAGVSATYSPIP